MIATTRDIFYMQSHMYKVIMYDIYYSKINGWKARARHLRSVKLYEISATCQIALYTIFHKVIYDENKKSTLLIS